MSDWRPIETAPRDAQVLLFYPATSSGPDKKVHRNGSMMAVDYPDGRPRKASHWMPLPEPPED